MSNDELYAGGLLNRALDPATQPPQIRAFLQAEIALLSDVIIDGMAMIDVGCGTGRHLAILRDRLRIGVGVDYEHGYIVEAHRTARAAHLHFVTGDATRLPLRRSFDIATCLTNTWGTMSDKLAVLDEMRRLAPMRLVSVYAEASIPARREWYRTLGQNVVDESDECLITEGGFRSEQFTEARLRTLVGECTIRPFADIAYLVLF
jgi:ubiquinone/menaquinone biosynthesis C-methylase UbiE